MSNNRLILDDSYLAKVNYYISNTTEKANFKLSKLLRELESVISKGVVDGETSIVLNQYVDRVKELSGVIEKFGDEYVKELSKFQKRIDEIDDDLY